MTKGRLDKKQRLADQRRKRAQAAAGLAHGGLKAQSSGLKAQTLAAHSLGAPQVPLASVAPLGRPDK